MSNGLRNSGWVVLAAFAASCADPAPEGKPGSSPGDSGSDTSGDTAIHTGAESVDEDTGGETAGPVIDTSPVYDCSTPEEICTDAGCAFDGDAQVVRISGTTWLNGGLTSDGGGEVRFRDLNLADLSVDVPVEGAGFSALLPRGDWSLVWSPEGFGGDVSAEVHAHEDVETRLDAARVEVSGTAAWEGVLPNDYRVTLAQPDKGFATETLQDGSWTAQVPVGSYEVRLRVIGLDLSGNGDTFLAQEVDVEGPTHLALDGWPGSLSGAMSLATRSGALEIDRINLSAADEEGWYTDVAAGAYSLSAPEGTYELWVDYRREAPEEEEQGTFVADADAVIAGDVAFDYPLTLHEVTGSLTVAGVDVADTAYPANCPVLRATEATTGGYTYLYCPGGDAFRMSLATGTYDFTLTVDGLSLTLAQDVLVSDDLELDLVGALHTVTGTMTYDGGEPPVTGSTGTREWDLVFTREDADDVFRYRFDGGGAWAAEVPEGVYTVTFEPYDTEIGYATGTFSVASAFGVPSADPLDIDIAMVDVAVTATLDGAVAPQGKAYLYSPVYSRAWLDDDGAATMRVPPGTYAVLYRPYEEGLADSWWLVLHPCVVVRGPS